MKTQLKTIRAGLEAATCYTMLGFDAHSVQTALTALTQLEAMVGSQEPVAWVQWTGGSCPLPDDAVFEYFTMNGEHHGPTSYASLLDWTHDYQLNNGDIIAYRRAAPAAQQPQARPDFTDEWTGYLKNGETPFERFLRERKDVQSVLKLYQRALEENERLKAQQPQAEAVWVNPELEHMAEEAECVSMCLNDRGVPSKDGSKPLSLWGRVQQYANPRFLEGMTTNTPIISSEHIKALAQVCRLIGNYTTAEFVQNVVGFAQVLLANKAVQEEFVKANAHLLYAAPQQAEAVPPDVVRDAARYRFIRDNCNRRINIEIDNAGLEISDTVDAAIDAAIAQQPQAEPFGYVSQHTNGLWEFSPTTAGVYPDTAKSITAVYAKQPQAEWIDGVPHWTPELIAKVKRMAAELDEPKQPQAEAVPPAYVLVPIDVLEAASESLGSFVSDNGWTALDMQAMDNLDAILAQQKGGV